MNTSRNPKPAIKSNDKSSRTLNLNLRSKSSNQKSIKRKILKNLQRSALKKKINSFEFNFVRELRQKWKFKAKSKHPLRLFMKATTKNKVRKMTFTNKIKLQNKNTLAKPFIIQNGMQLHQPIKLKHCSIIYTLIIL